MRIQVRSLSVNVVYTLLLIQLKFHYIIIISKALRLQQTKANKFLPFTRNAMNMETKVIRLQQQ